MKRKLKVIVLAAGFATRLGELGERCAKSLLDIGGKPLIEYIVDKVNEIDEVDDIIVVSNDKFYDDFVKWKGDSEHVRVKILNDGSTSLEDKRGTLGSLEFVLGSEYIDDDILVLAGDNLIEFSLRDFYERFKENGKSLIAVYDIRDIEKVRNRYGVVVLDDEKVVDFQEKPSEPKSTIKSFLCYLFKPGVRDLLNEYLREGNPDASGYFIEWLCLRDNIYAYDVGFSNVYDIGSLEGLESVRRAFA